MGKLWRLRLDEWEKEMDILFFIILFQWANEGASCC